jgi:hypothetical protein
MHNTGTPVRRSDGKVICLSPDDCGRLSVAYSVRFKEICMRKRTLLAGMAIAVALVLLSGCAEKQEGTEPEEAEAVAPSVQEPERVEREPVAPEPAEPNAAAEESAAVSGDAADEEVPMPFGRVLVAWNAGQRNQAITQFLNVVWEDPTVFQGIPVLTMSEQQFTLLAPAQQDQVNQQAEEVSKILGDLARGLFSAADDLASSGNAAAARSHLDAVRRFGQALAAPEHMAVIQALGQAIAEVAQEKQTGTPR